MIRILREYIKFDNKNIPNFINCKSVEHHNSYNVLDQHIFTILLKCCVNKFISQSQIEEYSLDIFMGIVSIKELSDDDLYIKTYSYILDRITEYEMSANKLEIYECSNNFKLLSIYLKNLIK